MTVNISNFSEPVAVNRLRSTRRDFAQHFIFGEMLIFSTIYLSNRLTSLGGLNFFNWVIIVATILTTFGRPIILKLFGVTRHAWHHIIEQTQPILNVSEQVLKMAKGSRDRPKI